MPQFNQGYKRSAELSQETIRTIMKEHRNGMTIKEIAAKYRISYKRAEKAASGKLWKPN